jgi:hypothetical protein
MPLSLSRCGRCGLVFARCEDDTSAAGPPACDPCLRLTRRGRRARPGFDPRDAPLFRALAAQHRRPPPDGPRPVLGLAAGPGPIAAA